MARVLALLLAVVACGGRTQSSLNRAGDPQDEGGGELARASIQLGLGGVDRGPLLGSSRAAHAHAEGFGGEAYGGGAYGGDAYGGASYAGWTVPQWNYTPPLRVPHYNLANGLSSAVEGVVTWTGAAPGKLATACGTIDNPSLRVGSDKGLRGVVVYIEKVSVGRPQPYYGKPAGVGGVVAKHGCALLPAAQVVAPLPAAVSVHGDGVRARVRVTVGAAAAKAYDLQEGGIVQAEVKSGLNEVDSEDGKLAPAWLLGLETPYYAITDDAGRFRIDELAGGTYDVAFWQAPLASSGPGGTIAVGAPTLVHRTIHVDSGKTVQLNLALPAR